MDVTVLSQLWGIMEFSVITLSTHISDKNTCSFGKQVKEWEA